MTWSVYYTVGCVVDIMGSSITSDAGKIHTLLYQREGPTTFLFGNVTVPFLHG